MKKQCYMKYTFLKAMALCLLAALLISFPYAALAMELPTSPFQPPPFPFPNETPRYPENNANAMTLNVRAEQTDGPKGSVVITAFPREFRRAKPFIETASNDAS